MYSCKSFHPLGELELIILEKVGTADLVYWFVELNGSCTLSFDLVFGLESGRLWKNLVRWVIVRIICKFDCEILSSFSKGR